MSCIYALCDADGNARYVGKTAGPVEDRILKHARNATNGARSHAYNWLRSVGLRPHVWILEEDPADLNEAERRWIAEGRKLGWLLTNQTDGGDGGDTSAALTSEGRARMGRKDQPRSAEHRAAISAALMGNTNFPLARSAKHRAGISAGLKLAYAEGRR